MQRSTVRTRTGEPGTTFEGASAPGRARDALAGGVAGAVATAVMSGFRAPISRSLPPTAWFWSEYVAEGTARDHLAAVLGLHLLYGVSAGAAFGVLFGPLLEGTDATRERRGFVAGVLYGAVLSVFGVKVVLNRLLGIDLDPDERFVFHVSHLVYGATLGTLFGSVE